MSAARHAPATLRNREPLLAELRRVLPARGLVLEIASGTGEHAAFFTAALPDLAWQPTDPDEGALASIAAHRAAAACPNLLAPLRLDAAAAHWPILRADAVIAINMVHIAPRTATDGLLRGAGRVLPAGGVLCLYGPYLEDDVPTAPSNLAFDADLRARDPRWGLRRLEEVTACAGAEGLLPAGRVAMPANNLFVVFRRGTDQGGSGAVP